MITIAKLQLNPVGSLVLLCGLFWPHQALPQLVPVDVPSADYFHGSVSLGFDHSYGTIVPTAPRLFVGSDWRGSHQEAEWFVIARLYQAFGTFDGVTNPRESIILSRLTYPAKGLLNRGWLHGFVVALPIESVGAGFEWASTQGVGLGIWPLKTKLLTISGGMGPGFQYVDPTQEPSEVLFAGVYQALFSGHLTDTISYASLFMGTTGAGNNSFVFNISKIIYRFHRNFSAQIGVISFFDAPYTAETSEFFGHSRIALTYHIW